jgi:hypothetical protein
MSYSEAISSHVDKIIIGYIEKVVSAYPVVSKEQLLSVWGGNFVTGGTNVDNASNELSKMNKPELQELCKGKGLRHTGSKPELVKRLVDYEAQKTAVVPPVAEVKTQPKLIHKEKPPIALHRNKFGNFEHTETRFVFNNKTEKVYGKQNDNGSVSSLTPEDIDICNKFKFLYDIPFNLSSSNNAVVDKAVLELEEEEEVEVEEEEEEEEAEEEEEELEVEIEIEEED